MVNVIASPPHPPSIVADVAGVAISNPEPRLDLIQNNNK